MNAFLGRFSLRVKLNITMIAVTVAGVFLVALVTNRITTNSLTAQLGRNLSSLASSEALTTGDLLISQLNALRALSLNRALHERIRSSNTTYSTNEAQAIRTDLQEKELVWTSAAENSLLVQAPLNNVAATELKTFQNLFADHTSIFITDKYGALVATTNYVPNYDYFEQIWWQSAYNNGVDHIYISQPRQNEETASLVVEIALPIYDDTETTIGVLHTQYNLTTLLSILNSIEQKDEHLITALLLPNQQLLHVTKATIKEIPPATLSELMTIPNGAFTTIIFDNIPSLLSLAPVQAIITEPAIDQLNWQLIVYQDKQSALAPVTIQQHSTILITSLIILITALIATAFANLLTQPLRRLNEAATEISNGNFDVIAAIETQDEIGTLATTFNQMTRQIQSMFADLADVNKELENFAYIVSHDLKAPLRAIFKLSEWIEESIQNDDTVNLDEYFRLLRHRTTHMQNLIAGILDYSRAGHTATEMTEVNLNELLPELVALLEPPPTFTVIIAPNMPTFITAKVKLSQVFSNLISNAIKYHHQPENGCIEFQFQDQNDFYQFSVADNGPGIAPQHHQKVFDIFQTVHTRTDVDSTGIGLAVIKKIIEEYKGTIYIESELNQGATFIFTWPKDPPYQ